jgi:hypothetical protein
VIPATWEAGIRKIAVRGQPGQIVPRYLQNREKWTGDVIEVVEHMLCKWEAPSSNPSPTKKKKKSGKQPTEWKKAFAPFRYNIYIYLYLSICVCIYIQNM